MSANSSSSYVAPDVITVSRAGSVSGPSGTVTEYVYPAICAAVFERASPKRTTIDILDSPKAALGTGGAPSAAVTGVIGGETSSPPSDSASPERPAPLSLPLSLA